MSGRYRLVPDDLSIPGGLALGGKLCDSRLKLQNAGFGVFFLPFEWL
jgi:hypothetical protein